MSSAPVVYMNTEAVTKMAKTLSDVSDVLNTVAKVLEMISDALKNSFFIGFIGMAAVALIEMVRPQIQQVSDRCASLSDAVNKSVEAFKAEDTAASNNFMTSRLS